jgi:hypothetical protein
MSCGLGAIILVFMLVKYNEDTSIPEIELLKADMARLEAVESALRQSIGEQLAQSQVVNGVIQLTSEELARLQAELSNTEKSLSESQAEYEKLRKEVEAIEVAQKEDIIETPGTGEENYLIGLKVEGRKIAILLDSSASMTDEILIDVIRRKNSPDSNKMAGPKWQRAIRIVHWLLARLPAQSDVTVIAFDAKAQQLGRSGWVSARDATALGIITRDLDTTVPTGSTNLQAGLEAVKRQKPTSIYLITDGLPTEGDSSYKSLSPFADCSALWGASNKISGECRLELFNHTLASSAPRPGVPVNVILLPIEGDPKASPAYWSWASISGGLLISPAETWP